jgi:hypothetical protein
MNVAFQEEDIQLLAKILQEQLLAQVPSGELFQVKCAVKNDELMILTQHPPGVAVDTPTIFALLENALQWQPNRQQQGVQFFLRIAGEKHPYAKHALKIKVQEEVEAVPPHIEEPPPTLDNTYTQTLDDTYTQTEEEFNTASRWGLGETGQWGQSDRQVFPTDDLSDSSSTFTEEPILDNPYTIDSENQPEVEEIFDPLADVPDLRVSRRTFPIKQILIGVGGLGVLLLLGGSYIFTRPCGISDCPELQTAEKLNTESRQILRRAKSEQDLVAAQKQFTAASTALAVVPSWSSRSQQAQDLSASLSSQAAKINLVLKGLQAGSSALETTQTPATSIAELQARQNLWRQAITPLESVRPNSELYNLVQSKLLSYRVSLQQVNQQLFTEQKWLQKLTAAKAVAEVNTKREAVAKTGSDWQKLESNWQIVVNSLKIIPKSSSGYQEAQTLLAQYEPKLTAARDRATKEQLASKTYAQAVQIANQAKAFAQKNQWQAAVTYWDRALQTAKQVSGDSLYSAQAQALIEPYTASFKEAQEKLRTFGDIAQTRADLEKTCVTDGVRFCTFTIDNEGIKIRLTPEYDQALQASLANAATQNPNAVGDVQNHYQSLQTALAVISDNANLSLYIYGPQGQQMYTRQGQN